MDWPDRRPASFGVLSPFDGVVGDVARTASPFNNTATTWGTNQRAVFIPITVQYPVTVYQMAVTVSTQAGNIDVGIYDLYGARIVANGNVAMAAAGVQAFNITDTTLAPGYYNLAVLCNNSTAALRCSTVSIATARASGVQMQDVAADNLPSTATFAAMAVAMTPWVTAAHYSATF